MLKKTEERNIVKSLITIHKSALLLAERYFAEEKRNVYITPSMYLDLINNLKHLYSSQRKKVEQKSNMYNNGVDKIIETQKIVDIMKGDLEKKKPVLLEMEQKVREMQVELEAKEEILKPIYEKVKEEEFKVNEEFKITDELKRACEEDLKVVKAVFDEARQAISTITASALFDVKSYQQPPKEVRMVLACICIISNKKPEISKDGKQDWWPTAKTM